MTFGQVSGYRGLAQMTHKGNRHTCLCFFPWAFEEMPFAFSVALGQRTSKLLHP